MAASGKLKKGKMVDYDDGDRTSEGSAPENPIVRRDFMITATQTNVVNDIDISNSNVLAYNLTFNVMYTYKDGSTSILLPVISSKPMIMYENKLHQSDNVRTTTSGEEGNKKYNAFKNKALYKLRWDYFKNDKNRLSLFIESSTSYISDQVVIHPGYGSESLTGCKSLLYTSDVKMKTETFWDNSTNTSLMSNTNNIHESSKQVFKEIFIMSSFNTYGIMNNAYLYVIKK
ncbi:hypothetical protein Fleli_0155 [Bernardetia litoralis DSM 6794]|uniref:Uncharacterized protein n=1 Tax=Bernardetia litoralis (strain ATCC 23117 / DSM 6794 / NBRC 15988 / NCIMB 1366 / Fx l1 / Sio-4) TaxID=880071 RepID=I4AFB9_BERLS|nr:hypothetical protein [Bernardetia litoralis]AFM02654.1 hypothetical protein Fleli_0155 [Bernardetia litoralis DSM 6794]